MRGRAEGTDIITTSILQDVLEFRPAQNSSVGTSDPSILHYSCDVPSHEVSNSSWLHLHNNMQMQHELQVRLIS